MQHLKLGDHFSTRNAQGAGVSRSRLRRADLLTPHHGVRATTAAHDIVERCRAFQPAMNAHMLFSHTTAALLHGLPLPQRMAHDETLHVSARAPCRAPRHSAVHGHQTRQGEDSVIELHGLPVSSPVETWCQLASLVSERDLVLCGDALLRRQNPLASMEELSAAVDASPRRPGVAGLRAALPRVRARTDSPMESVLRLALVDSGLPEPVVNYRITGRDGEVAAHGDLVYPDARVVVEYDGDHHRSDARQYHIDIDRLWRTHSLGWDVLRINSSHMTDQAAEAVRRVRLALAS